MNRCEKCGGEACPPNNLFCYDYPDCVRKEPIMSERRRWLCLVLCHAWVEVHICAFYRGDECRRCGKRREVQF
jgi:hypothetical protein